MNSKISLFGYSILWISVLSSNSNPVEAETVISSKIKSNTTAQKAHRLRASQTVKSVSPSQDLKLLNIAPPEVLPIPVQRFGSTAPRPYPGLLNLVEEVKDKRLLQPEASRVEAPQSQIVGQKRDKTQVNRKIQPTEPLFETKDTEDLSGSWISANEIDSSTAHLLQDLNQTPNWLSQETTEETSSENNSDPELGNLQLRERPVVPGIGQETTKETSPENNSDPELGNLQLRERPVVPRRSPETIFLLGRFDYFRSDNILLDDFDPVDDQLFSGGVTLLAVPSLGPRTQVIASLGGELVRYSELTELDYYDFQIRAGVRHRLFPRTYGQITFSNQQFFANDGDRILSDHSMRLSLSRRDRLAPQLNLDSFYQFRISLPDPSDRSRISNTLGAYLSYNFQPDWEVGLDYQFVLTDFIEQQRQDSYHQLTAQLSYDLSRSTRISLFAGLSFGRSSEPDINFDSSSLGVTVNTSLPLF